MAALSEETVGGTDLGPHSDDLLQDALVLGSGQGFAK